MFDLSTTPKEIDLKQKHFTGVYVDNNGMLDTFHYVLEGSYYHDEGTKYELDLVMNSYKNRFITFRSYSNYNKITDNCIDTNSFQIESQNPIILHRTAFENKWGSFKECLELSLRNEAFTNVYATQRNVPNMDTRLVPFICPQESFPMQLIILTDDGLKHINGILRYEFRDDRSDSCPSCVQGFISFEESVNKIRKHIISGTNQATFSGDFIHTFDYSTDMAITRSLYDAFRPVIELARIKTITFEEIK